MQKVYRIAFIALSIWAVVSCFIIFRGSAELDGLRVRAEQIESDFSEATSNLASAGLKIKQLGSELASALERAGNAEDRAARAEKSVRDILAGIGSARGDAREVGSLAREIDGLVSGIQGRSGDKNKAP